MMATSCEVSSRGGRSLCCNSIGRCSFRGWHTCSFFIERERSIQLFVQLVFNQLWVVPPILPQRQAEPFGRRHRSRARSSQRSPLFAAGGTIGEDCHILALVQAC